MLKRNVYLSVFFTVLLIFAFIFIYGIGDYRMPTPAAEPEPAVVEEEPVEEAEVYTGIGEGYGGEMTVEVFLDKGQIVDIKVIEHQDTDNFAIPAFEDLTEAVIEAQSTNVDLISGATASSEGFLAAVDDALAQADPTEIPEAETYTGTAEGYGGELMVEVLLAEGEILNIRVIEHSETDGISDPALEETPQDIVESQNTEVEAVSGATVTSEAIMAAVRSALDEADWGPEVAPQPDEAQAYTATAEGYGSDLTVEVELTEREIINVRVIEHSETEGIAEPALEQTPQDIIDAQSTNVDAVSGATVTSEAIMAAVQSALDEADWDPEEEPVEEPEPAVEPELEKAYTITTTAEGYGGEMTVEVDVMIADVRVVDHKETEGLAEPALEEVPRAIVKTQSTDVDVVTGVTKTSEAVIEAVRRALTVEEPEPEEPVEEGQVLTGTAEGYGGDLTLEVNIDAAGQITAIEVIDHSESEDIGEPAFDVVPPAIIESQDTDVDILSGATKTSKAIITAVERALADKQPVERPPVEAEPVFDLEDGSYTGSGSGFYNDIEIEVVIEDGRITSIEVISHEDVPDNAEPAFEKLISDILASQSTEQDTVSGATYSSEGFLEALEDALGL